MFFSVYGYPWHLLCSAAYSTICCWLKTFWN